MTRVTCGSRIKGGMDRVAGPLDRLRPNPVGELDRRPGILDSVAATREDLLIDPRMQIAKPRRELDLLVVYQNRAMRVSALVPHVFGEMTLVHREEPPDVCVLKLHDTAHSLRLASVNLEMRRRAKEPEHHVE